MSIRREVEHPFWANLSRISKNWLLDLKQHWPLPDAEKGGAT
jgi:hypothetical protein